MNGAHFADVVGWMGVSLGAGSTYVQFHRARRISVDGISLVTWFQFVLMGMFWITYGIDRHSPIIVAGALIVAPMQIYVVSRLEPLKHRRALVRSVIFIGASSALPAALFGWTAGVYGIGVAMVFNRLPQILTLARNRGDLGVSVGSWLVGSLCSVMWIVYYAGVHNWAPAFATAMAMAGNLAIAGLAYYRHHQADTSVVVFADAR